MTIPLPPPGACASTSSASTAMVASTLGTSLKERSPLCGTATLTTLWAKFGELTETVCLPAETQANL